MQLSKLASFEEDVVLLDIHEVLSRLGAKFLAWALFSFSNLERVDRFSFMISVGLHVVRVHSLVYSWNHFLEFQN